MLNVFTGILRHTDKKGEKDMKFNTILFEKEEHIATITMNRPEKLNACNIEMYKEINKALDDVEGDDDIRVVIITGAGDKAFSTGVDITELEFNNAKESMDYIKVDAKAFRHIENIPQPVIAAVNGYAFGYGCKVAIVSDIVIASEKAIFGLQGVSVGAVHVITLGRGRDVLNRNRLAYMLLTGDSIDAHKAESFGLVTKVVPAGQLYAETKRVAKGIAGHSPLAVRIIKRMLHRGSDDDYRYEDLLSPFLLLTEDLKEGREAFIDGRKPTFKGR